MSGILLSVRFRVPVITAWSTPGAALLIAALPGFSLTEAVGAFVVCGALLWLSGATGFFARLIERIPPAVSAGMLAGVLLRFGLRVFAKPLALNGLPLAMFALWLVVRHVAARYAVLATLSATDLATLVLAPFGAFAVNLAAITAAMAVHPERDKRYIAEIWTGIFYLLTALCADVVVVWFMRLPPLFVLTLAGLALIPVISASLHLALDDGESREAAMLAFLVEASGVNLGGLMRHSGRLWWASRCMRCASSENFSHRKALIAQKNLTASALLW